MKLNGQTVEVASAIAAAVAPRAVLVVDASGSMASNRKVAAAVYEILRSIPSETQLALVIFSDRVLETVPFGRPRQEIMDAVAQDRQIKGLTALRDALLYASSLLIPSQPGDSVILLSDGDDNKSQESIQRLKQAFLFSRVRLAALVFVNRDFTTETEEERSDVQELEDLAEQTGGATRALEGPHEGDVIRLLTDQVMRYYMVRIPLGVSDHLHLQLEVIDPSGKKLRGVKVSFSHELPNCVSAR